MDNLTEEEVTVALAKYLRLKGQVIEANRRYYDKNYKNTASLPDDKRALIETKKQIKRDYQKAKYQANKDYYKEASRLQRERLKELKRANTITE
jgi:hypothetical protein